MVAIETEFSKMVFDNVNVWGANKAVNYADVNQKPLDDFINAADAITAATGMVPNTVIISGEMWKNLKLNVQLRGLVSGGASVKTPALVQPQILADAIGVDKVYIVNAIKNKSVKGRAKEVERIFNNGALICYLDTTTTPSIDSPSAFKVFNWSGFIDTLRPTTRSVPAVSDKLVHIVTYTLNGILSQFFDGYAALDFRIVNKDLGYVLKNT